MTALPKHKTYNTGEISLMNQRALQQQGGRIAQLEQRLNEAEKALLEVNERLMQVNVALRQALDAKFLTPKRGPGRPKGSKNKPKENADASESA